MEVGTDRRRDGQRATRVIALSMPGQPWHTPTRLCASESRFWAPLYVSGGKTNKQKIDAESFRRSMRATVIDTFRISDVVCGFALESGGRLASCCKVREGRR